MTERPPSLGHFLGIDIKAPWYDASQHLGEVIDYITNFRASGQKRDLDCVDGFGGVGNAQKIWKENIYICMHGRQAEGQDPSCGDEVGVGGESFLEAGFGISSGVRGARDDVCLGRGGRLWEVLVGFPVSLVV